MPHGTRLINMLTFFQIYCYVVNGVAIFCNGLLLLLSTHKSIETIQVHIKFELELFCLGITVFFVEHFHRWSHLRNLRVTAPTTDGNTVGNDNSGSPGTSCLPLGLPLRKPAGNVKHNLCYRNFSLRLLSSSTCMECSPSRFSSSTGQ